MSNKKKDKDKDKDKDRKHSKGSKKSHRHRHSKDKHRKRSADQKVTGEEDNVRDGDESNSKLKMAVLKESDSSPKTGSKQRMLRTSPGMMVKLPVSESDKTLKKQPQRVSPEQNVPDGATILIAPEDYANFYSAGKSNNPKVSPNFDLKIAKGAGGGAADWKNQAKYPGSPMPALEEDTPTALFAPDDYVNIFSVKKAQAKAQFPMPRVEKSAKRVPSDVPTIMFAPADYENIYSAQKKVDPLKNRTTSKPQQVQQVAKRVPSDVPTIMIAPEDYENIYSKKTTAPTKGAGKLADLAGQPSPPVPERSWKGKEIPAVGSDTPTYLIAPDDYKNIYSAPKREQQTSKGNKALVQNIRGNNPVKEAVRLPSDTPTALIAPADYVNIYKAPQGGKGQPAKPRAELDENKRGWD